MVPCLAIYTAVGDYMFNDNSEYNQVNVFAINDKGVVFGTFDSSLCPYSSYVS